MVAGYYACILHLQAEDNVRAVSKGQTRKRPAWLPWLSSWMHRPHHVNRNHPLSICQTSCPQILQAEDSSRAVSKGQTRKRPSWLPWLSSWVQRADQESHTCYVLFVFISILDFSLLTMLFPISLAAYALATQKPSRLYWQVSAMTQDIMHD